MRVRATAIAAAALCLAPALAQACTIIPFPPAVLRQKERQAFHRSDIVATVEAVSETYEAAPRYARLFFGRATGRVLDAKKGPIKQGDLIDFEVMKGEDGIGCPAEWGVVTGHRYRILLKTAPDGPPKMIWQREVLPQPDPKGSDPR